jgi:hypothetical protein
MKGVRSKDNYYLWSSKETNYTSTCLISKEDEVNLWHQKLGHLHLKGMKKIMSKEAIRGIPKLKFEEGKSVMSVKLGSKPRCHIQSYNIRRLQKFWNLFIWT